MTSPAEATIIPIRLVVNGRVGLTLWAPPWEEDGEEWQAFLGAGEKIELLPDTRALAAHVAHSADNDLADHPAWEMIQTLPADQLEPDEDYRFDLDGVPTLVAGQPTEHAVAELADVVDIVQRIAECVGDEPLIQMLDGPVFRALLDDEPSYDDDDWARVAATISRSWPLVIDRMDGALSWPAGDAPVASRPPTATEFWGEVGILPLALTIDGRTGYTLRCYLDDAAIFLGADLGVDIFGRPADLVDYIRTADSHDLAELDTWSEVRDSPVLEVSPASSERYDLDGDTPAARDLAADIAAYTQLAAVEETLDSDDPDWGLIRSEISSCLRWHD